MGIFSRIFHKGVPVDKGVPTHIDVELFLKSSKQDNKQNYSFGFACKGGKIRKLSSRTKKLIQKVISNKSEKDERTKNEIKPHGHYFNIAARTVVDSINEYHKKSSKKYYNIIKENLCVIVGCAFPEYVGGDSFSVSINENSDIEVSKFNKKRNARGKCQLCGSTAHFRDENNEPYLQVHYIKWISKGEEDIVFSTIALCPNCHRKMHMLDLDRYKAYLRKQTLTSNRKSS